MIIEKHKSIKEYNTFGVDVTAKHFVSIQNLIQLSEILRSNSDKPILVLGGGSNILFTKDIDALVIHMNIKGIKEKILDDHHVIINCNAGEKWHDLVQYCVKKDYGGIENLSLIPGNAGTAPIQNIGAYGVELKDVLISCTAMHIKTQQLKTFSAEECNFGYRDSLFKNEAKNQYIIVSIQLKLTTKEHILHTDYGAIKNKLKELNRNSPSIQDISDAIIQIRESKLPDPKKLGNGGSFFKNPILTEKEFIYFNEKHPEAPFYKMGNEYKVPAGWLIEHAGLKGYRKNNVGVHKKQALVLVNYGHATGKDILQFAICIQQIVKNKFGIKIIPEINIL